VTRQLRPKPVPPEKRSSRTAPGGDGKAKAEPDAPAAASPPVRRVKKKKKKRARR
jgi:hypothetical protein